MATMQYGDYVARIMLDERRGVLHGRVENLDSRRGPGKKSSWAPCFEVDRIASAYLTA